MKIKIIFATLAILLHGCGTEPEPISESQSKSESTDKKKQLQMDVLDPALETLNKAKGMEQQLQDAEAERKKKMDEQEKADNGTEWVDS